MYKCVHMYMCGWVSACIFKACLDVFSNVTGVWQWESLYLRKRICAFVPWGMCIDRSGFQISAHVRFWVHLGCECNSHLSMVPIFFLKGISYTQDSMHICTSDHMQMSQWVTLTIFQGPSSHWNIRTHQWVAFSAVGHPPWLRWWVRIFKKMLVLASIKMLVPV